MACRWHTTRMGGSGFSLYDLPKSVIAFAWDVNIYNLERNLHVFTWLLYNLANLLVNIFTFHCTKRHLAVTARSLFLYSCALCIHRSFFLFHFFLLAAAIMIYFEIFGMEHRWLHVLGMRRIIKCIKIEGSHQKDGPKKTQWSEKEVILTNDVFIFMHLNFRVCSPALTRHITCACQPFIHFQFYGCVQSCMALAKWKKGETPTATASRDLARNCVCVRV